VRTSIRFPLRISAMGFVSVRKFLTEFLPLRYSGKCKNFVGSAVLAEVCGLRVLVVSITVQCNFILKILETKNHVQFDATYSTKKITYGVKRTTVIGVYNPRLIVTNSNKLCAWRHDMPNPSSPVGTPAPHAPPSRRNVAVDSHAQYVLTVTAAPASRVKAAVSKAAW